MNYEEKYKQALERAVNLFVTNNISATAACQIFPELNESEEINYEKKYKKALEWMQSLYDGLHGATKEEAEHYLPELKETEDERIKKAIIAYISHDQHCGVSIADMIAWLEKHKEKEGEQKFSNIPSRETIHAIWELGNDWKDLTKGDCSTEHGTQLKYIQNHWQESSFYDKIMEGGERYDKSD